ncbi:MAG: efflux RND transporter permease subunit [Chromatiales bacterium]
MRFSHFFIDRPIFAGVLSIVIVIVGAIALLELPVAQYPEIAPPTVTVRAVYPGANAKVVAETVATPIEQEVNGVENMLYMSSQSTNDGSMNLTVTFKLGTDLDAAQVLVQNRVALAEPRLPEEVRRQGITVRKRSPDLTLVVNLVSPDGTYDQTYLSNYALLQVKDVLARLPGVGDILVVGARDYSMRVWLNPEQVAARGLTASDVVAALREQNVQVAAGVIGQPPVPEGTPFQFTVSTLGRLSSEEEFANIVIKTGEEGEITRVRDVARVELGAKDYGTNMYVSGMPSVGLVVFQLPGSNALETKAAIANAMQDLGKRFPRGLQHRIVYDTTPFVQQSIEAVVKTLLEAVILVALVVLVFLQTWRATLIPLLAVPVSLIGTLAVMQAFGFSLNTLSLFGMVLAIGIVVDDAIVVVENIERNIELGLAPPNAARKAMDEVSGPVVATALVLTAVFVPTAFITGITGQFYRQFALTIAVSTIISAFNSLTLSPALGALVLKPHDEKKDWFGRLLDLLFGWFFRAFNYVFRKATAWYGATVGRLIRMAALALLVYLGLLGLTYLGFRAVPTGYIPNQDQGYLVVFAQLPDAASLERTDAVMRQATEMVGTTTGVRDAVVIAGWSVVSGGINQSNTGTMFVVLDDFANRASPDLHSDAIANQLRQKLSRIRDAYVAVFPPPPVRGMSSVGGFKMMLQDRGSAGYGALEASTGQVIAEASREPGLVGLFTTFRANVPQLFVDVDRTKAKRHNVELGNIFETLQVYLGSLYVNDFNLFGRTYQVTAQADAAYRVTPEDIGRLKTRNAGGEMVPLDSVMEVREITGPDKVVRYNLYPAAEVNGGTLPGVSTSQAIEKMERVASRELPASMGFEWTELTYQQILAGNTAVFIFPLCVLFVFLTLAAQYESWSLPLAVILIVPMCLLSAIGGVWLRHYDNNVFTQIGFIVLVGLASKNAILIVEFANKLRHAGRSRFEAVVEAARLRFRPILMTSFAFILGVVPLVVSSGAGAEGRRALGTAVFSGMLGVTLFGLLLTPVFYIVIQGLIDRRQRRASTAGTLPLTE